MVRDIDIGQTLDTAAGLPSAGQVTAEERMYAPPP